MNTTALRQRLSAHLQIADDEKVIAVYALLKDDMQQGERISIAKYNKELDAAMEEIKRGEIYSHKEVVQMSKKWR